MRKKPIIRTVLALFSSFLWYSTTYAQVLIGTPSTIFLTTMNLDIEATDGTRTVVQKADGKLGLGTTSPSTLLHINSVSSPAVRIVDGTQGAGKVLTSDASGNVSWQIGNWGITGNASTTPPTQVGSAVGATNYWGTTDAKNLAIATNGTTRMIFDQKGNAFGGNYNIMAADSNTFVWGGSNRAYGHNAIVAGYQNVDSSRFSAVFGWGNSLGLGGGQTNRGVILGGGGNVVTAGNSYNSIINGSQNSIYGDCFESIISGYLCTITGSQKVVTNGQWNTLTNSPYAVVFGIGNSVNTSLYTFAHGASNTINSGSDYGIALGQSNTIAASHPNSMAIGKSVTTTASDQMAAKFTNGYRFFSNAGGTTGVSVAAGGGSWASISDSRSKENIYPLNYGLAAIMALRPVIYNYIGNQYTTLGFVAQEIKAVLPEVVEQTMMGPTKDYLAVKYTEIIPVITKALQELKIENDALNAKNTALEQRLNKVETKNSELEKQMILLIKQVENLNNSLKNKQ